MSNQWQVAPSQDWCYCKNDSLTTFNQVNECRLSPQSQLDIDMSQIIWESRLDYPAESYNQAKIAENVKSIR